MLDLRVVKRTGAVVDFDAGRIFEAIQKAVGAVGTSATRMPDRAIEGVVDAISAEIKGRFKDFYPNVENIQDLVEKHLVLGQQYEVAKAYILYRADRQKVREEAKLMAIENAKLGKLTVKKRDGRTQLLNVRKIEDSLRRAAVGLSGIDYDNLVREVIRNIYDQVETVNIDKAMVLAAASFIERDPAYSWLAGRLLLQRVYKDTMGRSVQDRELTEVYRRTFVAASRAWFPAATSTPRSANTTSSGWPPPCAPSATCSSSSWASRPSPNATSSRTASRRSSCPRPSGCGWRWASRSPRSSARTGRSSSTS